MGYIGLYWGKLFDFDVLRLKWLGYDLRRGLGWGRPSSYTTLPSHWPQQDKGGVQQSDAINSSLDHRQTNWRLSQAYIRQGPAAITTRKSNCPNGKAGEGPIQHGTRDIMQPLKRNRRVIFRVRKRRWPFASCWGSLDRGSWESQRLVPFVDGHDAIDKLHQAPRTNTFPFHHKQNGRKLICF